MFVHAGQLDVHVQLDGPAGAPPLVLLHSLGTNLHVWDAQIEALSHGFHVIRLDLRGHGLTTVAKGPYSIDVMARDVLSVLDKLCIVGRPHVCGLSIGGLIAQSMAAQEPDRVRSLLLCDTAMAIPPSDMWHTRAATVRAHGIVAVEQAVMARWVTPGFIDEPAAKGLRAMLLRTDPEGYAGAAEAIAACDLTVSTSRLRLPALVLVGDKDESTPLSAAQAIVHAIPGAMVSVIADAAHIAPVEQSEAVTAAMLNFLTLPAGDLYAAGMAVRKQVLGEPHVARATAAITDFDKDFQAFITRTAWGEVWTRPGLDRRTRSLLTLTMLAALGHHEELKLHIRASTNTGATREDIAEAMIQVAAYAGIPAANSAVRTAKETFREMDET